MESIFDLYECSPVDIHVFEVTATGLHEGSCSRIVIGLMHISQGDWGVSQASRLSIEKALERGEGKTIDMAKGWV
jgi:hypothetical protein